MGTGRRTVKLAREDLIEAESPPLERRMSRPSETLQGRAGGQDKAGQGRGKRSNQGEKGMMLCRLRR